ncbi:MAG: VTT domain-containing protein, partial [Pseudolabrys sp.]
MPLAAIVLLAVAAYFVFGRGMISLEALVELRAAIDAFVMAHQALAVLSYIGGGTLGATVIFLVARTALGEPLLMRAGPRAKQLAKGFREDAFSYLLFLRLVPAFPFFLVNLVPAFAGVRLGTFVVATAIGIIPGGVVYAFAGTGLDS